MKSKPARDRRDMPVSTEAEPASPAPGLITTEAGTHKIQTTPAGGGEEKKDE